MKHNILAIALLVIAASVSLTAVKTSAMIDGVTGTTFNLTAKPGYITCADGPSYLMWGYALGAGNMQYPGPTMIVNEGDVITVNLTNALTVNLPVSIVFQGITGVITSGGVQGLLTQEVFPGNTVQYQFRASNPGTYQYHSGSRPELEIEMGLIGALIVRPKMGANFAYDDAATRFDHEVLFLGTEMDPSIHLLVESGRMNLIDFSSYHAVSWFYNGRNGPDTMAPAMAMWLPNQPYDCMPRLHPNEIMLLRVIGGDRDMHPLHTHGNNFWQIAKDAKLFQSAPGAGTDLAQSNFTITMIPGSTADCLYTWTGARLGWDAYGHLPTDPLQPGEYAPDHGKPFPTFQPDLTTLGFGLFWSGSPFLGAMGALPPGEGGFNENGGYYFMWHSHNEREITNNDIFPGGMMSMMLIEPPGVPIP